MTKGSKTLGSKTFNKDAAIFNPAATFNSPDDIVMNNDLSKDEKVKALINWELDIRLNEVAVEENMPSFINPRKNAANLQDVHLALEKLGVFPGRRASPSKTGMSSDDISDKNMPPERKRK